MKDAEKIDPQNADIFLLKAQVALGRHHFKDANSEIRKAIAINPNRALYYGTLGDTQIELGEYTGEVESFQKLVSYIHQGTLRNHYRNRTILVHRENYQWIELDDTEHSKKISQHVERFFEKRMVQPARLELATSSFAGRRSNPTELWLHNTMRAREI